MSLYDRRYPQQPPPPQQAYTNEEEEDYDEEDEEDEEDDDDGDYQMNPALMNMSADLRRMLGLAVDEKDALQTDWRPPERPGLDNSAPIVSGGTIAGAVVVRPAGTFNAAPALSATSALSAVPPLGLSSAQRASPAAGAGMVYPTYRETERDDEDEEDEEEEEEEEDRESALSRLTNLSADLRRALGLPVDSSTLTQTQTDWRPPSKPGLDNSAPIIAPRTVSSTMQNSSNNNNNNNNNNNSNYINSNSKPLVPNTNNTMNSNINTNMINTNNTNSSAVKDEEEEEEEEEDDDDDDDEGDIDFIARTRSNGIAEIAMSAELRRALGLPPLTVAPSLTPEKTDWRPPTTFGLANSEPIVRTAANARPAPMMSNTLNNNNNNNNNNNILNSRSGEESFQYEYDEDDDEEEEEEREMDFSSLQMSDNLKRSLGLLPASSEPTMVTDWRPPEHSGLDNSDPIVPTRENVMRPLYNVRVPTSADAVSSVKKELIPRRITSSLPSDMRKLSNELQLSSELKRALGLE